ncbi:MAG: FAD/NAD(P)-binding protein, partial [Bacteroidia bacterium]|nr:FAD/NAD(P)-binding protein [Bacteroidia bacterium]
MKSITIIGGGASGLLKAANILRLSGEKTELNIVDPDFPTQGLAYSTSELSHLLN